VIKENKSVILKIFFIVLNLPYYIYKKLSRNKNKFTISSRIIKISTISVSIGILVTLISFSIGKGLQIEIKNKMFSIQSDIIISSYENIETGISLNPINKSNLLIIPSGVKSIFFVNQSAKSTLTCPSAYT